MKWLFTILVVINLIVFAGMMGKKMLKEFPIVAQNTQSQNTPQMVTQPQVVINMADYKNDGNNGTETVTTSSNGIVVKRPTNSTTTNKTTQTITSTVPAKPTNNARNTNANSGVIRNISVNNHSDSNESISSTPPRAQYKACSARVSIPEDDYHRIKGLLHKYPHAASRQIVEGGGEGNSQSSARMNVLFMSVNDQEASAIQGVVGRYGQLNRTPCDH